ncbi:MAG: methylisocitrate lyase [Thaumarchaeota archaeon]|nr:methylisocitrate lyase [Nitrososphaerota archaeon]
MRNGSKGSARRLQTLISREGCIAVPGVFSPSVALLAERAGFKAAYFSGAAYSGLLGLPDVGLTTLTEVACAAGQITARVGLPLIVDVDTGFGETLNVSRTVTEMERVGVAGIQIEDQVMPKRCGHLDGKQLVDVDEMVKKIIAAREASETGIVIVGRTDAASVEGIDSAVHRAKQYLKAGADMIFPEALKDKSEFREFARKVDAPLFANMTEFGKTEYLSVKQFDQLGYKVVIFPVTTFRAMMKAVQRSLSELALKGTQKGFLEDMMERNEFYDLIGYHGYERTDRATASKAQRLLDTN